MRSSSSVRLWLTLLSGVVAGALLVLWLSQWDRSNPDSPARDHTSSSLGAPTSYADAVKRAAPSVVNIFTSKVTTERKSLEYKDPIMQHYFGKLLPEQTRQRMETSLGSGVVVSTEGHVLTNLHILEGAEGIKVILADGSNVKVQFVGKDPDTDLAILKMNSPQAAAIPIGSSHDLRVGDMVLAIGNPFGVGQTTTMGIISATGRSHLGISSFENFIQTDAAINPGNSGGALINTQGELIGINTAIFSKSGGSHGIGFAVPVDVAINVLNQIVDQGKVVRGWIGLTAQDVTETRRKAFGLQTDRGVMASGALPDGPADQAGIRPGDVITHIGNRALGDVHDLQELIANAGPGRQLKSRGWRGSEPYEWLITTTERPAMPGR